MPQTTAFGVYESPDHLKLAVERLKQDGFTPGAITALFPENSDSRQFALANHTLPPEGTISGPAAAEKLDGNLGLDHVAQGPKRGALPGALRQMGIPEDESDIYGHRVTGGNILLSVNCQPDTVDHAVDILRSTHADAVGTGHVADPLSGKPLQ